MSMHVHDKYERIIHWKSKLAASILPGCLRN